MHNLLPVVVVASLFGFVSARAQAPAADKHGEDPQAVHRSGIVIDTHCDVPQWLLDENYDLATPAPSINVNLPKAEAGNLGAEFFSIWVDPKKYPGRYAQRAFDLIDSVYRQAEKHPDRMVMAFTADDIERARSGPQKRLAALLGVEGGHAIENDLHLLRDFYRLGVRYMTLTWSNTNEWADSSGDINKPEVKHHNGLTPFGKDVVREMNRLGMMVDISHVSDKTFYDAIATSRAPVIASHSSARALCNNARDMTDDMLGAVARNGGVVNVNFFSAFVDENYRKAFAAQKTAREAAITAAQKAYSAAHNGAPAPWTVDEKLNYQWGSKIPRPPFKSLIDQIDHIAKVAGVDHVGLGSDFDGVSNLLPQGIDSAADLPKITQALMERGYSTEDVTKILGGNMLRVMRDVERVSREIQKAENANTLSAITLESIRGETTIMRDAPLSEESSK
jgi:membrane dipeptidase